jgi:hypothetical protein
MNVNNPIWYNGIYFMSVKDFLFYLFRKSGGKE